MQEKLSSVLSSDTGSDQIDLIRSGLLRLKNHATRLGLSGRAFSVENLESKSQSENFDAARVLEGIRSVESVMINEAEIMPTEITKDYELSCVNRALWTFGLRSKFDLSEYVQEGDVIEIYNAEFFQLYRNLLFFELTGYEFLDLVNYQFQELYSRPEFVTQKVMELGMKVFKEQLPVRSTIPAHEMVEILSKDKRSFVTEYKYVIPLHDKDGNCAALMSTITPKLS